MIKFAYETGASLYCQFDDDADTCVAMTEGSSLKAGYYTLAESAIATAGLAAGTYLVRIRIGTAGSPSASDPHVGTLEDYVWDGTATAAAAPGYALAVQQDAARLFALDESSGTAAVDAMGNADASYVGSPTLGASGPHTGQQAVTLNGSSQYVSCGTLDTIAAGLTAGQGCTFAVWLKTSNNSTRQDIFGSLSASPDTDIQLRLNNNFTSDGAGYLACRVKGAGTSYSKYYSADSGLCDGSWHHLAVLFRGNSIRIYVDGTELTLTEGDSGNPSSFGSALPTAMALGATNSSGTISSYFTGSMSQCVWIPWLVSKEVINELGRDNPAAIVASPTTASPYVSAVHTATRYAVDITASEDAEYGVGAVVTSTDAGDTLLFKHGSTSTSHAIVRDNLANREGTEIENGVVAEVKRGTRTLVAQTSTGTPSIKGFIVRAPDSDSNTVIEAGGGTHCAPRATEHLGVTTRIGCRLYDGARYAWNKYSSVKVFDGIAADDEERYHNGCAIVSNSTGVVFLSVGHNQPYLRVKTCTGNDLSSLSSETQLGAAATELTYVRAAFTDSGLLKALVRDQQGVNGLAVMTISDVFGTPTLDSIDYVVSGEVHYPRSLYVSGEDVYILHQHREIGSAWQEISGCWYDASEGTWKSLDGNTESGASTGTLAAPRFSTPSALVIVDNETDDDPQRYLLAGAAWDVSGTLPKFAAVIAQTATSDATAYADTTIKLLGYDGTTATQTSLGLDTGNSYRQSATVRYRNSKALVAVTDRGSYKPYSNYDETALYYAGWGGPRLRVFEVTDPFSTSPTLAEWVEPTVSGDVAGWVSKVQGSTRDAISYQAVYEGDHLTRAQGEATVAVVAPDNTNSIAQILEDTGTTLPAAIASSPDPSALDKPAQLLPLARRHDGVIRSPIAVTVAPGETAEFGFAFPWGAQPRPATASEPTGLSGELSGSLIGVAPEWVSYQVVASDDASVGTTDYAVCEVTDKDGQTLQLVATIRVKALHP